LTTPFLLGDVAHDEGLRLLAYPDPISPRGKELAKPAAKRAPGWAMLSGSPWTIGHGHCGPEVHEGLIWTPAEAREALQADLAKAMAELDSHAPWWRSLIPPRADVLANMSFNLGWPRLSGFRIFLASAEVGDYRRAAAEMLNSAWAGQVGDRATRLADQMRTGLRVPP
jgi:lysozyme